MDGKNVWKSFCLRWTSVLKTMQGSGLMLRVNLYLLSLLAGRQLCLYSAQWGLAISFSADTNIRQTLVHYPFQMSIWMLYDDAWLFLRSPFQKTSGSNKSCGTTPGYNRELTRLATGQISLTWRASYHWNGPQQPIHLKSLKIPEAWWGNKSNEFLVC